MQWDGLTGKINPAMIKDNNQKWEQAVYYVAGPPKMVEGMKDVIKDMHIKKERIHIEKLTGY